jgi:3-oxoacyl-[acyl-carrier-protein] synthase-3
MNKTFERVKISAVSAAVPKQVREVSSLEGKFGAEEISRIKLNTGIERMHVANENQTASDLCFTAAISLLDEMKVLPSEIDALISVTSTPDYISPANSLILQERLGLSKSTACFDLVAISTVYFKQACCLRQDVQKKFYY